MNKLSYFLLGASGLILASCANEDFQAPAGNGDGNVSITLQLPQINTRAYADGTKATRLQYAVYENKNDVLTRIDPDVVEEEKTLTGLSTTINLQLVKGHTYDFVFWASAPSVENGFTSPYTVKFENNGASVEVNYDNVLSNEENLDAFYAHETLTVEGAINKTIELNRPFAQINLLTNDYEAAKKVGYVPSLSKVEVTDVYQELDLISGAATEPAKVTYDFASINKSGEGLISETTPKYEYLNMVYVLANSDNETVKLEYAWKADDGIETNLPLNDVPVKRNHRTNIYGALLTNPVDINVVILPGFDNSEDIYLGEEIADGVTYDKDIATFYISNLSGLKWLNEAWQGNKDLSQLKYMSGTTEKTVTSSFSGTTIKLTADIDMSSIPNWTPLGNNKNKFAGNFDGQNHTISNLTVNLPNDNYAGFLGCLNEYPYVHNLKIENANLKAISYAGGIVAASHYSSQENPNIINCHVKNLKIELVQNPSNNEDGNDAGGIVGMLQQGGGVKDCSVTNAMIMACRDVAGIAGKYCHALLQDNYLEDVTVVARWDENYREPEKVVRDGENTYHEIGGIQMAGQVVVEGHPTFAESLTPENTDRNIIKNVKVFVLNPNEVKAVNDATELKNALSNVEDGKPIVVTEKIEDQITSFPNGRKFTIKGLGAETSGIVFDYISSQGSDITFEDITVHPISNSTNHTASGIYGIEKATFKNVNLDCEFAIWGGEITFNDCTFTYNGSTDPENKGRYGAYIYGGEEIVFNNCVFDQTSALKAKSKAILIYPSLDEGKGSNQTIGNVTVNECKFIGGPVANDKNAAVEIHTENTKNAGILTINYCTYDEVAYPGGLWQEVEVHGDIRTSTKFFEVWVDEEKVQDREDPKN